MFSFGSVEHDRTDWDDPRTASAGSPATSIRVPTGAILGLCWVYVEIVENKMDIAI